MMLKKLFLVSVLMILFGYGCAPNIVVVQPPAAPPFPNKKVDFTAPVFKDTKFREANGKRAVMTDNVTVEVDSIVEEYRDKSFSVSFEGPNNQQFEYSLFPMVVVLKITNNTDHIVTLERTIVRLEDEQLNEYPMVSTVGENKPYLIEKIRNAFKKYREDVEKNHLEEYRKMLNGEDYKKQYEAMIQEIKEARSKGAKITTPYWEARDSSFEAESDINFWIISEYAPERAWQKNTGWEFYRSAITPKTQEADNMEKEALKKIENINFNLKGVITSGVYQPINILPGRMEKVLIPFSKRSEDDQIRSISIGVYDLPTKVDQAGVPIKRANFNFKMVAAD